MDRINRTFQIDALERVRTRLREHDETEELRMVDNQLRVLVRALEELDPDIVKFAIHKAMGKTNADVSEVVFWELVGDVESQRFDPTSQKYQKLQHRLFSVHRYLSWRLKAT